MITDKIQRFVNAPNSIVDKLTSLWIIFTSIDLPVRIFSKLGGYARRFESVIFSSPFHYTVVWVSWYQSSSAPDECPRAES